MIQKRSKIVQSFLFANVVPNMVSLGDILSVAIDAFISFITLMDLKAASSTMHATKIEDGIYTHVDWKKLGKSTVYCAFDGEFKIKFLYKYIKALMHMDLLGNQMNMVMVLYIWELIKGFAKEYPHKKQLIDDLYLDFFFFPQKLSLMDQTTHMTLCFAWFTSAKLNTHNYINKLKVMFLISPLTPYEKYINNKCTTIELFNYFMEKAEAFPSVYLIRAAQVLEGRYLNNTVNLWNDKLLFLFIKLLNESSKDPTSLLYFYIQFPEGLALSDAFLDLPELADAQKLDICHHLASYYHLCAQGSVDDETRDKNVVLMTKYLKKPLDMGWAEANMDKYIALQKFCLNNQTNSAATVS